MAFDDIPEDKEESYWCDICGGNVTRNESGDWSCDGCEFVAADRDREI